MTSSEFSRKAASEAIRTLYIYTEDIPVSDNTLATGLSRAAPGVLRSIAGYIEGIAVYPVGIHYAPQDFDPVLAPLCNVLSKTSTIACKTLRRFSTIVGPNPGNTLPARLLARMLSGSNASVLLGLVGADVGTLVRADKLATLTGKQASYYIVDDFVKASQIAGKIPEEIEDIKERTGVLLRRAGSVFTITEGLGDLLREYYQVQSTTLPLVFQPEERPIVGLKNQITFVGSINFLYSSGLRDLLQLVGRIRETAQVNLTIRLTSDASIAQQELGPLPDFVHVAPMKTALGLAEEIASSLFAFLPYSFERAHATMVATSFPSKAMEYLAYARSIVVYGPEYGSATRLFRHYNLSAVAVSPHELEQQIRDHIRNPPDNNAEYRKYLNRRHSAAGAADILKTGLSLDRSVLDF